MDGAGNTLGTVTIYAVIVLIAFLWYKQNKKNKKGGNDRGEGENGNDFLTTALSFSKPAAAMRNASNAENGLLGTSANTEGGWI